MTVQVRYRHGGVSGRLEPDGDLVTVELGTSVRGVAPGQAMVFYEAERVVGSAWIERGVLMRIAFVTLGCKANAADARMLEEAAALRGDEVSSVAEADAVVVNTCTVTHRADADGRAALRRARRARPSAVLVATGCLSQIAGADLAAAVDVDLVVPNTDKGRLLDHLHAYVEGRESPWAQGWSDAPVAYRPAEAITGFGADRGRPFLKIQDGCDRYCSYCIIPHARGPVRSLPPEEVLAAVRRYAAIGAGELVLTGIHVGRYGHDLPGEDGLAELLALPDSRQRRPPSPARFAGAGRAGRTSARRAGPPAGLPAPAPAATER